MPSEIEEIRKTLEQHEKRIRDLENRSSTRPEKDQNKELSAREFLNQQQPRNDVEKTLVVAYYLENFRDTTPFNISDLETIFKKAKESVPDNMNDKVNQNIAKGYMDEMDVKKDKKKAWFLTATGKKAVEDGFKKEE
jgi:hypothetical protein